MHYHLQDIKKGNCQSSVKYIVFYSGSGRRVYIKIAMAIPYNLSLQKICSPRQP